MFVCMYVRLIHIFIHMCDMTHTYIDYTAENMFSVFYICMSHFLCILYLFSVFYIGSMYVLCILHMYEFSKYVHVLCIIYVMSRMCSIRDMTYTYIDYREHVLYYVFYICMSYVTHAHRHT